MISVLVDAGGEHRKAAEGCQRDRCVGCYFSDTQLHMSTPFACSDPRVFTGGAHSLTGLVFCFAVDAYWPGLFAKLLQKVMLVLLQGTRLIGVVQAWLYLQALEQLGMEAR